MTNLEKLMALGAENCHPKLIAPAPDDKGVMRRCVVGNFVEDDLYLTDEGKKLLAAEAQAASSEPGKKKGKTKSEPVVPAVEDTADDDLDLG